MKKSIYKISQRISVVGVSVIFLVTLSACCRTGLYDWPTTAVSNLQKTCQESNTLLTDLTQSPDSRVYILPNNEICPNKVNTHATD